jgi:hypothetical protein
MPKNKAKEIAEQERCRLLSKKICKLSLTIEGTRLEKFIAQLYRELEDAGVYFKPGAYLSDEWGCPQGSPVIGIPFYLSSPQLHKLEGKLTEVEAENDEEIMMYLRHEAGHAFNYAYRLHAQPEWRRLFGDFSLPYNDTFRPVPFSTAYVRHIPGWYAQKHPDEDFAESFAVWLTPDSGWQENYKGTPALKKILYIAKMVNRFGRLPPQVTHEKLDLPVEEINMTLDAWYDNQKQTGETKLVLPGLLNYDLTTLFPDTKGISASKKCQENRKSMIDDINRWTGINRKLLSSLIDEILKRMRSLKLKIGPENQSEKISGLTVFITTLATNYVCRGSFIE